MRPLGWLGLVVALLAPSYTTHANTPHPLPPSDCLNETTLENLVDCIKGFMPTEDSEEYIVPTAGQLTDWQTVVTSMLGGNCESIVLPVSLQSNFTIAAFTDNDNSRSYCVFTETADGDNDGMLDLGWGTFIVYAAATTNLAIDISHPLNDTNTPEQGIVVFKNTGARTFSMANAHRRANAAVSACQTDFQIADAAHNTTHTFHASLEAMDTYYSGLSQTFHTIQFHGMGTSSCVGVDVYITHGRNTAPQGSDPISDLKTNFLAAIPDSWNITVTVPGDSPSCNLTGTTNVQGRLLNGVTSGSECGTAANAYSGQFIHIEQKRDIRRDSVHTYWVTAINNTSVLPVELTTFEARQHSTDVVLTWATASETQNAGFDVQHAQRLPETPLDWQTRIFVPGHGTTLTPQRYTSRLPNIPPGSHVFRLRQQDYDGSVQYSSTIDVLVEPQGTHYIAPITPNPFQATATFTVQTRHSQHVTVHLFDNLGRLVQTPFAGRVEAHQPTFVQLDGQRLADGSYHVRIVGETFQETRTVSHVR